MIDFVTVDARKLLCSGFLYDIDFLLLMPTLKTKTGKSRKESNRRRQKIRVNEVGHETKLKDMRSCLIQGHR